jgi:signal transduction histidine kinase
MAASLLHVPIAVVSLVDTDRIWFKSGVGLDIQQINRDPGLCDTAILHDDIYVVENTLLDPGTLANPLVAGEFGLRFYAAAPLTMRDGYNLGTLCLMDKKPRHLRENEKEILKNLATILIDLLELRFEAHNASSRQNQILGMVAHELKNPLAIIPVYADLIKEQTTGKEHIEQMCNHIRKASDRMTVLIKEVLETARLQLNEITLNKSQFDISTIIGRAATLNVILANAKKQKLFIDITDNIIVYADEVKMMEIADNLISNAIKYSPADAEIHLRLTQVFNKAIFEVMDGGPGLTEEDMQHLFKPYTRLSARPTAGESSTGVGLSIVKLLVEAHDGLVWAEIPVIKENMLTAALSAAPELQDNI